MSKSEAREYRYPPLSIMRSGREASRDASVSDFHSCMHPNPPPFRFWLANVYRNDERVTMGCGRRAHFSVVQVEESRGF